MDKKNFLISPDYSLKTALKKLDETAEKVLIVIDQEQHVIGSLSDGDIRRHLLKGGGIDVTVASIYNRNVVTINKKKINSEIINKYLFKDKLGVIPVTDVNGKILDCITAASYFDHQDRIVPDKLVDVDVVIMAGGKGVRMEPFTSVLPKPLLPIGDKTIIEKIIDEFSFYGPTRFHLSLNYKAEMIEAYFKGIEKNYEINFFREKDFYGTAGSLAHFKNLKSRNFIVSNCDVMVKADYADLLDFHVNNNADLTIVSSIQHYKIPYGVIDFGKGGVVTNMREKPEYTFTINTGVYIVNKSCLDFINEGEYLDMTALIDLLISKKKNVITYPVNEGDYMDIGQWDEYHKVVDKFLRVTL